MPPEGGGGLTYGGTGGQRVDVNDSGKLISYEDSGTVAPEGDGVLTGLGDEYIDPPDVYHGHGSGSDDDTTGVDTDALLFAADALDKLHPQVLRAKGLLEQVKTYAGAFPEARAINQNVDGLAGPTGSYTTVMQDVGDGLLYTTNGLRKCAADYTDTENKVGATTDSLGGRFDLANGEFTGLGGSQSSGGTGGTGGTGGSGGTSGTGV